MAESENKIGARMPDGSIYLGFQNGKDWYAAAEDAKDRGRYLALNFNEAADYARKFRAHGHDDWALPSPSLLDEIFEHRKDGMLDGTFDESDSDSFGNVLSSMVSSRYWSSAENGTGSAFAKSFNDGAALTQAKTENLSVRYVRGVPRL